MTRRSDARAEIGVGLVCPACGALPTVDPAALRGVTLGFRLWARRFEGARAIVRAAMSGLMDGRRQTRAAPSHD